MDKKKVLFVVHQLNYGGVQKALISALNALDYDKFDVSLYVRKNRLDLLPLVNPKVREVIVNDDSTHYHRKPAALARQAAIKLLTLCGKKQKAEAVKDKLSEYIAAQKIEYEKKHYFSNGKKYDAAVAYIQGYPAKLTADWVNADRKIMFFHGSTDETHALHESIFDRMDAIVGVSEGVQKVLKDLYPAWKDKITCLENYVDAADIRKKSKEYSVEIPPEKTVLCTCGRFTPVKGFDLAVEAAKRLKEAGHSFLWYFVGDGPERAKIEAIIQEYGLQDDIVITGMQDNPYPWIGACDIYVQSSYEEAYGLTIAESQILCKPVVTTATVGGKTLVQDGENGLLCEINADALAESLEKLICDKTLAATMTKNLQAVDYSQKQKEYKKNWAELLEG